MKRIFIILMLLITSVAFADESAVIKAKMAAAFNAIQIKTISPLKDGIYEVTTEDGKILYATKDYLIAGNLISYDGVNVTKAAEERRMQEKLKSIDKSLALKIGKGKTEVIQITDPECPYCLKSEEFFSGADVTRLVYFLPLSFHKDAYRLSVHIMCAGDKEKEYYKVLDAVKNKTLDTFDTVSCAAGRKSVDSMTRMAGDMGVQGTPFFVVDGKVFPGADPALQELLKSKK